MNTSSSPIPLAIIGYSCCFPGGVDSPSKYWNLLFDGRSIITEVPDSRLARKYYYQPETRERGKSYSILGACIDYDLYHETVEKALSCFQAYDAFSCDEGHRLSLYTAAQALQHAGFDLLDIPYRKTGVYVGHSRGSKHAVDTRFAHDIEAALDHLKSVPAYRNLNEQQRVRICENICLGIRNEYLSAKPQNSEKYWSHHAARNISMAFDFQGPSLIINSACASSLIGLSLAAEALGENLIDMALVGGASYLKFDSMLHFAHAQSISTTGSCPFDQKADGFVPSESHVYVVIKTLRQAILDGDQIHAVIQGIGISSDGKGKALWAPRQEGQLKAIERAYRGSNHDLASQLDHIEAHATSTQLGDATELNAVRCFLENKPIENAWDHNLIRISSCKANIGHSLESAGLSGLLKILLEMKNEIIVRQPNLDKLSNALPSSNTFFEIPSIHHVWKKQDRPRTAAVNAFGIGGLNAHVVLQDHSDMKPNHSSDLADQFSSKQPKKLQPIAVIGMSCLLPNAKNLTEFEEMLRKGVDPKTPPPDRWNLMFPMKTSSHQHQGQTILEKEKLRGGYLTNYVYDWKRHKVPPLQVRRGNPLQFMILDAVAEALADAGFSKDNPLPHETTGVVIGSRFDSDFNNELQIGMRLPEIRNAIDRQLLTEGVNEKNRQLILDQYSNIVLEHYPALNDESGSFTTSTLASRITKTYDLMGGAIAVDAGCCSSFAALDVAMNSLRSGSMDLVICGGGQQSVGRYIYEEMIHHDGVISPPAEGAVVLILKRLEDAVKDGDTVHAVLHGMSSKQDQDLIKAQSEAINDILEPCKDNMDTLCMAELATRYNENQVKCLMQGLEILEASSPINHRIFVGSLSEQIGHAFGASGIFSLLKSIVELKSLFVAPVGNNPEIHRMISSKKSFLEFPTTAVQLPKETSNGRLFGIVANADRDGTVYTLLLERGTPVLQSNHGKRFTRKTETTEKHDAPLSPIRLYDDTGHSPFERGKNHGIQFAKTIRKNIFLMKSLSKEKKHYLSDRVDLDFQQKDEIFPAWAMQELHGLAEGCMLPIEDLFAYNMNLFPGCVQFLFDDSGEILHGMNLDLPLFRLLENAPDNPIILRRRFLSQNNSFLYASIPGQIGCIVGINAKGLSITSSMLLDRPKDQPYEGHLHPFLVAEMLEKSDNVDSAMEICCKWTRAGSWGMILSDTTTSRPTYVEYHGPVLRLEQNNTGFAVSNHSILSKTEHKIPSHSESRLQRMVSLLKSNPPGFAKGLALLRDKFDWRMQKTTRHRTMHTLLRLDNLLSWAFLPSKNILYVAKTPFDSAAIDSETPYEQIDLNLCFQKNDTMDSLNIRPKDIPDDLSKVPRSAISYDEFATINTSCHGKPPIDPGKGVCHRFVLRTVPADLPDLTLSHRFLDGVVLLVGRNSVVDALYDRIIEHGGNAKKLDISGPWDAILRRFDQINREGVQHIVLLADHNAINHRNDSDLSDTEKWNYDLNMGFYRTFELLQHWLKQKQDKNELEKISILSSSILGGDFGFSESVEFPQGGALEGLMKALRREMKILKKANVRTKYVDHSSGLSPADIAENLFAELIAGDEETEIGYVNKKRYTSRPVLAPINKTLLDENEKQAQSELHGTWIFTGGAQGITAVVAREFGRNFNCKLRLVGSTSLDALDPAWRSLDEAERNVLKKKVMKDAVDTKKVPIAQWRQIEKMLDIDKNLKEMHMLGIDAEYYCCDVTQEKEVERLVGQISQKDGPIVGIVHGAGFESSCRFEKKKLENVRKTVEIKVSGARFFMKYLDQSTLKYFVGFGSTSGRFGGIGQTDYSSANDMLSKLLEWYGSQNKNCRTLCIQWTAWGDVGMAVRPESKDALKNMERKFLPSLEGARHFMNELVLGLPEPEVTIVEWDYYKQFYPDEIALPFRQTSIGKSGNLDEPLSVELGIVQETLLIPLYFRAKETQRKDAIIRDEKAVKIINKINYDFERFKNDHFLQLEIAVRSEVIDLSTQNFINTFPDAVVVNLGAGLDDRFSRVDNGMLRWFDLDMPDSISLRRQFFEESPRNSFLEKSMFDYSWIEDIFRLEPQCQTKPILFIAEGLCQYFTEEENKSLFKTIADHFPQSYMLFHSICSYTAEHTDISISVSTTRAKFKWGIDDNKNVETWDARYKLLEDWHFIKRHAWRWIKLGIPTVMPQYYRFYYQNMKVGLLSLGEQSNKNHWNQKIR